MIYFELLFMEGVSLCPHLFFHVAVWGFQHALERLSLLCATTCATLSASVALFVGLFLGSLFCYTDQCFSFSSINTLP